MKTIHVIARTRFTYSSITIHLSLEHRPSTHYLCHVFPDSPSFPAAQATTPSHDAPARPLLGICLSAIQPKLVLYHTINPITTQTVNNYHIHVNNNAMIIISVYHLNYTKYDYWACHPANFMADTLYANNGLILGQF